MGVFSVNNMLQENFTSQPVLPIQNSNESYYSMSLEYCKLINEEYDEANKIFYRSLVEAGDNYTVINESFDGFFTKVKEIVAKFIKFLKNLIDKFILKLNQLVKSDKYIKNHEKDFSKFGSDHEFDMKLFDFTFLDDPTIPQANAYTQFTDEFATIKGFVTNGLNNNNSILGKNDTEQLTILKNAYKDMTDREEDVLDEMRGKIIGEKNIDASDYSSELFRKFRNGDDTPSSTTVTSSMVNMSLLRFKNHDKSVKAVKEVQKKLEKSYNDISKHLEKCVSNKGDALTLIGWDGEAGLDNPVKLSGEVINEINLISKSLANKVQLMSNVHLQATGAKLDAIKDAYKQDKSLLYKALSELQKWKNVKEESSITPIMHNVSSLLEMTSAYENYRTIEIHNQRLMNDYFVECMALESHNVEVMQILSEGVVDSIKEFISKILNGIKTFFAKISESLSRTFKNDQDYLTKYKDIILNKKPKIGTLNEYYDFKIKDLVSNTPIPEFHYESLKPSLASEEAFRSKYFGKIQMKSEDSFTDACKLYFMGDPKDIESEDLNMTDLYNFCWDFENTKKALDKELNKLSTAQANAIKAAEAQGKDDGSSSSEEDEEPKTPAPGEQNVPEGDGNGSGKPGTPDSGSTTGSSDANPNQGASGNNEAEKVKITKKIKETEKRLKSLTDIPENTRSEQQNKQIADLKKQLEGLKQQLGESVIYSKVYGGYISEAAILEIGTSGSKKDNSSTGTGATPAKSSQASKNLNLTTGTQSKDMKKSFSNEEDQEKLQKEIMVYFNTCNSLLTAKLTVVKKIYEDYMWIIREHVRSYVGTEEAGNKDHAAKVPTVKFTPVSDELYNKLNEPDKNEYKEHMEVFKAHFKRIDGVLWFSAKGNLAAGKGKKTGKKLSEQDPAEMTQAYEQFLSSPEGEKMKKFSDRCKEEYGFPALIPDLNDFKVEHNQPVDNTEEENNEENK